MVHGNLSITEYCHCLKTLADCLGDVDQAVSDETMVLQTVRGFNENYSTLATLLSMQTLFPSLIQTRSLLLLEENKRASMDNNALGLVA